MKKKTQRFLFTLPLELLEKSKAIAKKRNISLSLYICESLWWRLKVEEER